jgi:hypothetical protein
MRIVILLARGAELLTPALETKARHAARVPRLGVLSKAPQLQWP